MKARAFRDAAEAADFAATLNEPHAHVVVWDHACQGHPCNRCGYGISHDVPADGGHLCAAKPCPGDPPPVSPEFLWDNEHCRGVSKKYAPMCQSNSYSWGRRGSGLYAVLV